MGYASIKVDFYYIRRKERYHVYGNNLENIGIRNFDLETLKDY